MMCPCSRRGSELQNGRLLDGVWFTPCCVSTSENISQGFALIISAPAIPLQRCWEISSPGAAGPDDDDRGEEDNTHLVIIIVLAVLCGVGILTAVVLFVVWGRRADGAEEGSSSQ